MSDDAAIAAHLAASHTRALAALLRHLRNLDQAEDALQEASCRALQTWPERGIPRDPTAWLIRTGRNAAIDALRRTSKWKRDVAVEDLDPSDGHDEDVLTDQLEAAHYKDDILRLMFLCSQPGLPLQDQLALALKVLCGLTVDEIARAFLVPSKTMGQRITRAKKKASAMAGDLHTPSPPERLRRLDAVALMLYLMFNEGYSATSGSVPIRVTLCDEAIRLTRLLLSLFPGQSEVRGLLALFLLQHSRRSARLDEDGQLVPLDEQNRSLWDQALIQEGRALVEQALRSGRPGPYPIQAAIAATHAAADTAEATDWQEIEHLYRALEILQPTPVVRLNRAVAIAKVQGPEVALDRLDALRQPLQRYLPFHATRAALLRDVGDLDAADRAYETALSLAMTAQERTYLEKQQKNLRSQTRL